MISEPSAPTARSLLLGTRAALMLVVALLSLTAGLSARAAHGPGVVHGAPGQAPAPQTASEGVSTAQTEAILRRYFPDVWAQGMSDPHEQLWVMLGASGEVWFTGRESIPWPPLLVPELQARYPGVKLARTEGLLVHAFGPRYVRLTLVWVADHSPVSSPAQIDYRKRPAVFVSLLMYRGDRLFGATGQAFDVGGSATSELLPLTVQWRLTRADRRDVRLHYLLQSRGALVLAPSERQADVRLLYGQPLSVPLMGGHGQAWRLQLRAMRLRELH